MSLYSCLIKVILMKQSKKLTRNQKEALKRKNFNPEEYRYLEEDKVAWRFIHKETKDTIWIGK